MHFSICGLLKIVCVVLKSCSQFFSPSLSSSLSCEQTAFKKKKFTLLQCSIYPVISCFLHLWQPTGLPWGVRPCSFYLLPDPRCVLCGHLAKTMERLCDISLASVLLRNRNPASVTAIVTVGPIKQLTC